MGGLQGVSKPSSARHMATTAGYSGGDSHTLENQRGSPRHFFKIMTPGVS
jgi:hypothetical protein